MIYLNISWSLWCVLREVRWEVSSRGQGSQEQIWHADDTNVLTIGARHVWCVVWGRLYVNNINCRNKPANGQMKSGKNRSDDRRKRTWWMEWWREERPSLESDCWMSVEKINTLSLPSSEAYFDGLWWRNSLETHERLSLDYQRKPLLHSFIHSFINCMNYFSVN